MRRGEEHRPACAARWREQAERDGWTQWQLVHAIHTCCGVSLLKAQRLARGWKLADAVREFHALAECDPGLEPLNLTENQLNHWENSDDRPRARTIDRLCLLYRTRPDRLGLANDYSEESDGDDTRTVPATGSSFVLVRDTRRLQLESGSDVQPDALAGDDARRSLDHEEDDVQRRQLLRGILTAGVGLSPQILEAIAGIRMRMEDTLNAPSASPTALDHWELMAERHGCGYQGLTPLQMLSDVVLDFAEVQQMLSHRQPVEHRKRLCHVAAQLAGITAIILHDLGDHREAHAWFRTARLAAEEPGDRVLRAWLVAREAMVPLNFGAPQAALKMATQARALAGATPSAALALACAVESRARALLGQKSEAKAALRRAETVFTQLPDSARVDNWYGYPERKHFVHASHALTLVGATREAYSAQDNALRLASPTTRMSTALIRIDRASCMVKTGHLTEGFQSAGQVLLGLPQEFRTPLVLSRARGLVNAVPERDRNHRAVREYRDILALGTQLA